MRYLPFAALLATVALGSATPTQRSPAQHGAGPARAQIRIPESMRVEHAAIHDELERATRLPGRVGQAARELARVLHPHFVREEQIALPPLGLLGPLARGEVTPAMRAVLPMTDSLRAELAGMLREHQAIRAATARLGEAARAARAAQVVRLAEELALHARTEEEVFYPAAILVGDQVRARLAAVRASR